MQKPICSVWRMPKSWNTFIACCSPACPDKFSTATGYRTSFRKALYPVFIICSSSTTAARFDTRKNSALTLLGASFIIFRRFHKQTGQKILVVQALHTIGHAAYKTFQFLHIFLRGNRAFCHIGQTLFPACRQFSIQQ